MSLAQSDLQIESAQAQHKVRTLQLVTIIWMTIETGVSIFAAAKARSVALGAFGGDSAIELASAAIVYLRFRNGFGISERTAAKLAAIFLFGLAAFIVGASALALLSPHLRPEPSLVGIVLLIAAAVGMPFLAARKRRLATILTSDALKADAVQSTMCAYLAWIALGGLVLNATFHLWWADPAAALLLLPIILKEANEARRGQICGGHCM